MLSGKPRRPAPAAKPVAPAVKPVAPGVPSVRPQVPAVPAPRPYMGPEESSTFRTLAFYFGVALIFLRVSVFPEMLGYLLGTSLYVLYIVTPPALGGVLFGGGLGRTLQGRAGRYWMAFFVWMGLATIFSSWVGGSLNRFRDYGVYNLMLLFIVAGLATDWGEIRVIFYTIAAACLMNLLEARLFMDVVNGRMQLWENGTISNSNDLASQLLLVLPFVLWVAMDSKRNVFLRIPLFAAIAYGLWVVVGTASRGALLGIIASFLFILWRANMRQRLMAILAAVVLSVIVTTALPSITSNRLGTLFGEENEEARQSADARNHLFRQSLTYTFQHPLFGVGPDQFSNYQSNEHEVKQAMWHPTHCAWTQVSSENGVPGLIFFVLGLGSAIFGVSRSYRMARERGNRDIANACFCYLLAMAGFLVSITFLSNAYSCTIPLMVGLGIAMSVAATKQLAKGPAPVPMMPAVRY
jgi:putative inorganic carbon (HCO3(-)) transporter